MADDVRVEWAWRDQAEYQAAIDEMYMSGGEDSGDGDGDGDGDPAVGRLLGKLVLDTTYYTSEHKIDASDLTSARLAVRDIAKERLDQAAAALADARQHELEHQLRYGTIPRPPGLVGLFNHLPPIQVEASPGDWQSDPVGIGLPVRWDPEPMRFTFGQGFGGFDVRRDPRHFIITTDLPAPDVPGVAEMLEDGWVWTGWRFARDQEPTREWTGSVVVQLEDDARMHSELVFVRTGPEGDPRVGQHRHDDDGGDAVEVPGMRWVSLVFGYDPERRARIARRTTRAPGRFSGYVRDRRVHSGRYAERLPTNRKRKRERAKTRRRRERSRFRDATRGRP